MSGRVARRLAGVAVLVATMWVSVPAPARAGVPPPPETREYCARLVVLRDTVNGVRAATSAPDVFARIRKAAKEFRRVAADAPETIADEMKVLAASFSELDRALRPLASTIGPAKSQAQLDRMTDRIDAAYTKWSEAQDQEAVTAAAQAVDDWTEAGCGFRLSGTTETTETTVTTGGATQR